MWMQQWFYLGIKINFYWKFIEHARTHTWFILFTYAITYELYSFWRIRTVQKMNFSIKDFFSKCDQIRSFLRIWSHWLKKSLMETFIFVRWRVFKCKHTEIQPMLSLNTNFIIVKNWLNHQRSIQNLVKQLRLSFLKIVNGFQLLTIFAKSSVLDIWQVSE